MQKRIAIYCRVSTDQRDQVNSLHSQQVYFENYIKNKSNWVLTQTYVDQGISGTSIKNRKAFTQMLIDAQLGEFDYLITKEISRFARNTLDSIFYTRRLKEYGVGVIFANDNINTLEPDAELRLAIMSSIAQEESRRTSQRVKWGQKRRMEQGVVFGCSMLGYDVKDGSVNINEKGAEIVKIIFEKYVNERKGVYIIAKELYNLGIPTYKGNREWSPSVLLKILKNEKYMGDLCQKKTYTEDYLNHARKENKGEEEKIYIKNHHKAIISRELFIKAQKEIKSRKYTSSNPTSLRYALSGKIKCGSCTKGYISRTVKQKNGSKTKIWRCSERIKNGTEANMENKKTGCNNKGISDNKLKKILMFIFSNYIFPQFNSCNKEIMESIRFVKKSEKDKSFDVIQNIEEIENFFENFLMGILWNEKFYGKFIEKIIIFPKNINLYIFKNIMLIKGNMCI